MDYVDKQSGLIIEGEYHNSLDVNGFSRMMKNPSFCYKFYWLEAIVQLISHQDKKETTFNEIIDEMICNAWYTVLEFHVHLSGMVQGQVRDGLERAIIRLKELSDLPSNASSVEIKNEIRKYDFELNDYKEQLTYNVPKKALSGFFDNQKASINRDSINAIISYIDSLPNDNLLPYKFGLSEGLKREVYFSRDWIRLIQDNFASINGWIQFEKLKWLQNNNPEVPGLVYKLSQYDDTTRKLKQVRKLWEIILCEKTIIDVFKNEPVNKDDYDVDHFIPRSFVMNDELWNLMPMDSSLNSAKNNRLPKWGDYFERFVDNQFILYEMIHDDSRPQIKTQYVKCYKDNLHSLWANEELYRKGNTKEQFYNILEDNMKPLYDSAYRQGYQIW